MFLVQSSQNDASTNDVIDWIRHLYPNQIISRCDDALNIKRISHRLNNQGERLQLSAGESFSLDSNDIRSWWYRNGYWEFALTLENARKEEVRLSIAASTYLEKEYSDLEESIDHSLAALTKYLNRYSDNNTNKVSNLSLAASLGISIPDTIVTNDINDLQAFFDQHGSIITKALARNSFATDFDEKITAGFSSDTALLKEEQIRQLKIDYDGIIPLPALYQQYLEKKYELRIFFLNQKFYPMAIFSQANEQTRLDFRMYDHERPNRCVPYSIPLKIKQALNSMMKHLEMKSGSIDMIVTPSDDYVFLEVNPVGKYQWLRQNCNYDIDREIARFLAENME